MGISGLELLQDDLKRYRNYNSRQGGDRMTHDIPMEEMTAKELAQHRRNNPDGEPMPDPTPDGGDTSEATEDTPAGPVEDVDEVTEDELETLEEEGESDIEWDEPDKVADDDTIDDQEQEDTPASDEVRAEATGDEPPPKKTKPRRR